MSGASLRLGPIFLLVGLLALGSGTGSHAQVLTTLRPETAAAFDAFVMDTELAFERQAQGDVGFLWADEVPSRRGALRDGRILVEQIGALPRIPNALPHVWLGAMFVPEAQASAVLDVLKGYERHPEIYPEVVSARVLSRRGDTIRPFLRLLKKQVLTVVLNTEHEATWTQVSPTRWIGLSRSTKIAEVDNYGKPNERELPVGEDHGFLWRLNAYWRLEQAVDGVFVECLSVSLSRDIPRGAGYIAGPFVRKVPRRSLEATLQATRLAVIQ